jgi:hypothetical protein
VQLYPEVTLHAFFEDTLAALHGVPFSVTYLNLEFYRLFMNIKKLLDNIF